MFIIISVLSLIFITLGWLYSKRASVLPGVPRLASGNFFLGNMSDLKKNSHRFKFYILEKSEEIGKTFYMSFPMFKPVVILTPDARLIEYVLKGNFYNYRKSQGGIERFRELFGHGIFSADGSHWRIKRKIASHMFATRDLRVMVDIFVKDGHRVLDFLKNHIDQTIDAQKLFFSYTFSSFSEIAFGKDPTTNSIYSEGPFAQSFDRIQNLMAFRNRDQFWKLKRFLQITSREREISKHAKVIDNYAYDRIKKMKQMTSDQDKNPDLISRFLVFAKKNPNKMKGATLTDEYLRDTLVNFMIAGRDTTASTLTWLFFELDQNPDVAEKMTKEIQSALSDGGLNNLTFELVRNELKYVKAAISETLRLHPAVPFDSKESIEADELPDGTKIPGGVILTYSPWIFGRSKKLWGDDADVYRPERWIDAKEPSQYQFISFNAGLRLCLGKELAYLEATIMTAMILYSDLSLRLKTDHDITTSRTIILRMKHGSQMVVKNSKYLSSDAPTPHRNPQRHPI